MNAIPPHVIPHRPNNLPPPSDSTNSNGIVILQSGHSSLSSKALPPPAPSFYPPQQNPHQLPTTHHNMNPLIGSPLDGQQATTQFSSVMNDPLFLSILNEVRTPPSSSNVDDKKPPPY